MLRQILVFGNETCHFKRLTLALKRAAGEGSIVIEKSISGEKYAAEWSSVLSEVTKDDGESLRIAFYTSPWTHLEKTLEQEGTLEAISDLPGIAAKSLERWRVVHSALMKLRNQSSLILINGSRTVDFVTLLGDTSIPDDLVSFEPQTPEFESLLMEVVASVAPACLDLYSELEASAELCGREPEFVFDSLGFQHAASTDALCLYSSYRNASNLADAQSVVLQQCKQQLIEAQTATNDALQENTRLQGEGELLLMQLHQVHEEMEHMHASHTGLAAHLNEVKAALDASQMALAEKEQQFSTANQRNELLSSELESRELSVAELLERNAQLKNEGELFLMQLHQVQEELEHYFDLYKQQSIEFRLLKEDQEKASRSFWYRLIGPKSVKSNQQKRLSPPNIQSPIGKLLSQHKQRANVKKQVREIRQSGLFDETWYRSRYPDVAKAGLDPVMHYVKFGVTEGRNPGPGFDTRWYLKTYPDVAENGINPLVHYITSGRREGRQPMRSIS